MTNRHAITAQRATNGAAMLHAGGIFMITTITTATWLRGASG
jgi:hypothetical protein